MSIWEAAKFVYKSPDLIHIFTLYIITNAVFKSMNMICTIFLEAKLSEEGLGINSKQLSVITFISYFPSFFILMVSPIIVPKKISYKTFITVITTVYSIGIILTPFWK